MNLKQRRLRNSCDNQVRDGQTNCQVNWQKSRRYRKFNVGSFSTPMLVVVGIEKIAEVSYNKIFKADNGKEVIVCIPIPACCSQAVPVHLVTASEIATMDYTLEYQHLVLLSGVPMRPVHHHGKGSWAASGTK
jgi:hypothetical protein